MSANVSLSTPCGTNGCGCWPAAEAAIRNISTVCTNGADGTLLRLHDDDDIIIADELGINSNYCRAQFFVDSAPWSHNSSAVPVLVYRFRPVSQPEKYLDVSGTQVLLTDLPCQNSTHTLTSCESSFNFIPHLDPNGYYAFLLRSSSNSGLMYLSTNATDVIAASSPSRFLLSQAPQPCENPTQFGVHFRQKIESNAEATSRPTDPTPDPNISRTWSEETRKQCEKDQKQPRRFWKKMSCFQ